RMKPLTAFFLYGQMIAPYELSIRTPYLMIAFQLYPFAAKFLFDVDPRKLNDECAIWTPTRCRISKLKLGTRQTLLLWSAEVREEYTFQLIDTICVASSINTRYIS